MNRCASTFDDPGVEGTRRLIAPSASMPGDRGLDCTHRFTLDFGIAIGRKAWQAVRLCGLVILSLGRADVAAQQVTQPILPAGPVHAATGPTSLATDLANWVRTPILPVRDRQPVDAQTVIETMLVHAPEIRLLHSDVTIADAAVQVQDAAFDWTVFLSSNWDDTNLPVGSDLDGAQGRSLTRGLNNSGGIRRRDRIGGAINLGQDINFADSNSVFFNPGNQATTRIGITYEVPLLRDSGRSVATSRYEIAVAASNATREASIQGVQRQLEATTDAYWALIRARADWAIQLQNVSRAEEVCRIIGERSRIDSQAIQLARSKGTLASRQARLVRAFYAVELAQQRLNRTVLGASFAQLGPYELIPLDDLLASPEPQDLSFLQRTAVVNRPEIKRTLLSIKQAAIQLGVAESQLLPALGLTLAMFNQGLQGNRQVIPALNDQFSFANASFGVGLSFERPVGNRAARASMLQARTQIQRLQAELETVIADVFLEVQNDAIAQKQAMDEAMLAKQEVEFTKNELDVLTTRYAALLDGDRVGALYLDNLLQLHDRLATAQGRLLNALVACRQSEFNLLQSTGLWLR